MAGNRAGGLKAAATNKTNFGDDFYSRIASIGGKKGKADGVLKGFALMPPEKPPAAGALGGSRSKRPKDSQRTLTSN